MQYKIEPNALGNYPTWTISLYGLGGERAGDVKCVRYDINNYLCNGTAEPTFGGRRLAVVDRLGSTRATSNGLTWTHSSYYPYGEEKDPGGAEGTVRFGTYVRDSMGAGVDYANQRYYSPLMGRFFSPDPSKGVSIEDPVAWNRYAYVLSDPINYTDSSGLDADPVYPSDAVFRISSTASMDRSWAGQVSEFFIRYMQGTLDSEPLRDQNLFLAQAVGGARNRRVPWYQEHPCDRRDETNNRILSFMEANQADAKTIAAAAGIDYTFVLGIAAEETLYGTKGIVLNSNNFFGLHVNDANDAHHFANQVGVYIATNDGPVARFAPATGFLDSGLGFATVARAHVSGISNPGALARTLHQHGYGVTNPNYETELGSAINNIQRRVDCLK